MLAPGRREVPHLDHAPCLVFEMPHEFRKGKTAFVAVLCRKSAEIADRLEVDTPHSGGQLHGPLYQGPNSVGVNPPDKGGHKDNPEAHLSAIPDGPEFGIQKGTSPQGAVNRVINTVELKEDR